MMPRLRRAFNFKRYRRAMTRAERAVTPERRPAELDGWEGMWVAVKDGRVIAAAHNSRDLVPMVREKGDAGRGAVAQFVPHHTDDIVIGVG